MNIIPVILSGGSGTRLWPLSRRSKPKQFLRFGRERSLFQDTVVRCQSKLFDAKPIVVGADDHRFMIAEDLQELGVSADIILEPVGRSSCAAIAAGCLLASGRDRTAMVLALAADHHLPDKDAFATAVEQASADALDGKLVTFGVRPDRPATGYGYIKPGSMLRSASQVEAFIEKPDAEKAERLVGEGCLWNSGNFLFRADAFLGELEELQPAIRDRVGRSLTDAKVDLDFLRLDRAQFEAVPSKSVDHAVFEHTKKAAVLPVDYEWSDIGSWDALADTLPHDAAGNALIGEAAYQDSSGNIVHSEGVLTAMIGVTDAVVVATRDVVLVADRKAAEQVKPLVEKLMASGRIEANEATQIFRPWGNYERLETRHGYQVKRITVKPGGILSLQKHQHRAEHWVVVSGTADVTIGDEVHKLEANQSIYVAAGTPHRLANHGDEPVVLIEVQTGSYLGEDDIVRLEDIYGR